MVLVQLSIGTNLGDRIVNLKTSLKEISNHYRVTKLSSIYETEPWGVTNQPSFLNLCIEIETEDQPESLLKTFKIIEKGMGREKREKWGPREIDIDLLYYENLIYETDRLKIPHDRISERAFVIIPLSEINPDFVDPKLGKSIRTLAMEIDTTGITKYEKQITLEDIIQ